MKLLSKTLNGRERILRVAVILKYMITAIVIVSLIAAWRTSGNNQRLSRSLQYICLFLIVVNYLSDELLIRCPSCNKRITFVEYHRGKCNACGYGINHSKKDAK